MDFLLPLAQGSPCLTKSPVGVSPRLPERGLFLGEAAIGNAVLEADLQSYGLVQLTTTAVALGLATAVRGDVDRAGEERALLKSRFEDSLEFGELLG